ncbi:unnamed protein product, partial [Sphacelaria rigidula]
TRGNKYVDVCLGLYSENVSHLSRADCTFGVLWECFCRSFDLCPNSCSVNREFRGGKSELRDKLKTDVVFTLEPQLLFFSPGRCGPWPTFQGLLFSVPISTWLVS